VFAHMRMCISLVRSVVREDLVLHRVLDMQIGYKWLYLELSEAAKPR